LKREVRVNQSENAPTVLVSSKDWTLADESTISSEDGVVKNFKAPGAGEISLLKNKIVPIGKKKGAEFGTIRNAP